MEIKRRNTDEFRFAINVSCCVIRACVPSMRRFAESFFLHSLTRVVRPRIKKKRSCDSTSARVSFFSPFDVWDVLTARRQEYPGYRQAVRSAILQYLSWRTAIPISPSDRLSLQTSTRHHVATLSNDKKLIKIRELYPRCSSGHLSTNVYIFRQFTYKCREAKHPGFR